MDQLPLFDDSRFETPLYRSIWLYRRSGTPDQAVRELLALVPPSYGNTCSVYTDVPGRFDMWVNLEAEIARYRGGLLLLFSLKDIGRTKESILRRASGLTGVEVVLSDCPATMIFEKPKENHLAFRIATDIYSTLDGWPGTDNEKSWPGRNYPEGWDELYVKWKKREVPTSALEKISGVSHNTFYKMLNEYKKSPEGDIRTWRIG